MQLLESSWEVCEVTGINFLCRAACLSRLQALWLVRQRLEEQSLGAVGYASLQLCFWFGYICFGSVSISLLYWHGERAEQSPYLI